MMLDEEALANEQGRIQPEAMGASPEEMGENEAPQQNRKATPSENKMFQVMAKQALQFLTTEEASDFLIKNAQTQGPEQALATAAKEAIDGVIQAADAGGVQVPPPVRGAAVQIVVTTLAALMVKAGLAEDPAQLAGAALEMVNGETQDVAAG